MSEIRLVLDKFAKLFRRTKMRAFFHWKNSGVLIPVFIGIGGVMLGVGVSLPSAEQWIFVLAHIAIGLAAFWTIGYWFTSDALQERNPNTWSRKRKNKQNLECALRSYQIWKWADTLTWIAIFATPILLTHMLSTMKELSQLGGVLIAANDPDPSDHCEGIIIPANAVRVYFGNSVAWSTENTISMVRFRQKTVRGMEQKDIIELERGKNGEIFINSSIVSTDGKSIVNISRNHFDVNDNNIIKSLFSRPDHSTLILTDQYNNKLGIRYLNKHSIKIFGTFVIGSPYVTEVRTIQQIFNEMNRKHSVTIKITETGDMDVDGNFFGGACWPVAPGATAIGVGD